MQYSKRKLHSLYLVSIYEINVISFKKTRSYEIHGARNKIVRINLHVYRYIRKISAKYSCLYYGNCTIQLLRNAHHVWLFPPPIGKKYDGRRLASNATLNVFKFSLEFFNRLQEMLGKHCLDKNKSTALSNSFILMIQKEFFS